MDVHELFGLTYANYLVLPRSLLQSMPDEWQRRFAACVDEYAQYWGDTSEAQDPPGGYTVMARDEHGRFTSFHPAPHYRRGRTKVMPCR